MLGRTKSLVGAVALVLFAAQAATAAERDAKSPRGETAQAKSTVKAQKTVRAPVRHEYENVAGFKDRVNDPLYSFAAEPGPMQPRGPVIMQFPMPNAVWW